MVLLENLALCYIALAHQLFQGWMEKYACKSLIDFIASHCSELIFIRNPIPKYENGFYIYGAWRRVTFEKLLMKIYDFFYSAKSFSHPI